MLKKYLPLCASLLFALAACDNSSSAKVEYDELSSSSETVESSESAKPNETPESNENSESRESSSSARLSSSSEEPQIDIEEAMQELEGIVESLSEAGILPSLDTLEALSKPCEGDSSLKIFALGATIDMSCNEGRWEPTSEPDLSQVDMDQVIDSIDDETFVEIMDALGVSEQLGLKGMPGSVYKTMVKLFLKTSAAEGADGTSPILDFLKPSSQAE